MSKVVVSAALPGPALTALMAVHDVVVGPRAEGLGRDGFLALAAAHPDCVAIVPLPSDRVDDAVLAAFGSLRVVSNFAVGVDNVDLAAARARGIVVCNTPDVLTDATADLAMALLLAAARHVCDGDRLVRAGGWTGFAPALLLGAHVTGATLGIVGLGRIGRAVAVRAAGFGMTVLAASTRDARAREPDDVPPPNVARVPLDDLLPQSDFVSLHCPLTHATRELIDARALARMKRSAILVNTARGAIVDERALARALRDGVIAGAAIDVYSHEPTIDPELLTAPNTVLLPHLGSASVVARAAMARLACEGVVDVLAGRAPRNRVA